MMERIGFIGLGTMGKPMARNLIKAGYSLSVHSRSPAPVEELAREGAQVVTSPSQISGQSDVVITMLPDSPDVELVL
jgi:2-hydroxy-3-oxopropionate reductase